MLRIPCSESRVFLHFCNKSVAVVVIPFTPARMAGSGRGANSLECGPGRRAPLSLASFHFSGSLAPSQNMQMGGLGPSNAKRLKSSLAIIGSPGQTFSLPNAFSSDVATRRESAASLMVAATLFFDTSIVGARSAGMPAASAMPLVIRFPGFLVRRVGPPNSRTTRWPPSTWNG